MVEANTSGWMARNTMVNGEITLWKVLLRCNAASGVGECTWPDGKKYIGQYRDGKKHGEGTFMWENGKQYKG
jgi:hypothetical protein